jgi:hypothetical protein
MLIASKRKIRLSQSVYALLVMTFIIIALIPITVQVNTILIQNDTGLNNFFNNDTREQMIAASGSEYMLLGNSAIFILFILLGILTIIFYIPTLNSLGLTKFKGHRELKMSNYRLPEYGYTIPINGIQIRINRKLSSFKGLFLRELDFQIILPSNYKGDKRLFDFLACEQVLHSSNQIILRKRVDIQNIPLLVVRTLALISPAS